MCTHWTCNVGLDIGMTSMHEIYAGFGRIEPLTDNRVLPKKLLGDCLLELEGDTWPSPFVPIPLTWLMVNPRERVSNARWANRYHSRIAAPLESETAARRLVCMKTPSPGPETSNMLYRGGWLGSLECLKGRGKSRWEAGER